jgi:DNA-binding response OmpR family regulator
MPSKILIVDDEPEFVELICWVLKKEGFVVESARDGMEGLNKARSFLPDLILLDLMLPELDGTAVCEILRQLPSTATIPIVMLTGCATDACKVVALNAGVDEYLVKPCSSPELLSHIQTVLSHGHPRPAAHALDDASW